MFVCVTTGALICKVSHLSNENSVSICCVELITEIELTAAVELSLIHEVRMSADKNMQENNLIIFIAEYC